MSHRLFLLVCCIALASCVDKNKEKDADKTAAIAEAPTEPPIDAGTELPEPIPAAPLTGTHLDSASSTYQPSQPSNYQPRLPLPRKAKGKTIELVLRSTPPGSIASIDGKAIGPTPTFWRGPADGQAHEYTFTKEGYSMARYRFVATQSGVVHGSLSALVVTPHSAPAGDKAD
jgi:hypothetical protein